MYCPCNVRVDLCLHGLPPSNLQEAGELNVHIPAVISNHPDLAPVAAKFGIPFHHLPIAAKGDPGAKAAQEASLEELLAELDVDLVVLARYMQVRHRVRTA
jgi:formyltetrahydrofolate deformylase